VAVESFDVDVLDEDFLLESEDFELFFCSALTAGLHFWGRKRQESK